MAKASKKAAVKKTAARKTAVKKAAAKKAPATKATRKVVAKSAPKKAAKPKADGTAANAVVAEPLKAAPKDFRVRIRMYRHGLGDCFLLSFPNKDNQLVHFRIDCGIVLGTAQPGPVMTKVAGDIRKATGGQVDVLAITHEHWDHVSGFDPAQARTVFDAIDFKRLWLAWTEDETNDLANVLREERERKKAAAFAAMKKAKKLKLTDQVERLNGLLGFFGAASGDAGDAGDGDEAGEGGDGTAGALNYVKGKCKPTNLASTTIVTTTDTTFNLACQL